MMGEQFIENQKLVGRLSRTAFLYRQRKREQGRSMDISGARWLLGRNEKIALGQYMGLDKLASKSPAKLSMLEGIKVVWVREDSCSELVEVVT